MKKNVIDLNIVKEIKTKAKDKQELINQIGEELKQLFLSRYGYFPDDIELRPEIIEHRGIELNLLQNGHEDCPKYNYDLFYWAELEDQNIQVIIEYYRASVFQRIVVQESWIDGVEIEPYEFNVPGDWIASTMLEIMKEELEVGYTIGK